MAWKFLFIFHVVCVCLIFEIGESFGKNVEEITSNCPEMCRCSTIHDSTECQYNKLFDLPDNISSQVKILDLSHNNFRTIPRKLSMYRTLSYLNFEFNHISELDKTNLNISSLEKLNVRNNNIRSWQKIQPTCLNLTKSIIELDLSNNPIRNLSNVSYLNSSSLQILKMKNCSLLFVPNLFLSQLTKLREFAIAENENLKIFSKVRSESLEILDLSNCNLDEVNLSGFPNLLSANIKGNRISRILPVHFRNGKLKELDLSNNTIKQITYNAFEYLPNLQTLNLSVNVFIDLHKNTFVKNRELKTLLISRTYLQNFVQFNISSLIHLDLRINEIQDFESNSLILMPSLKHLILGNNLISKLPLQIQSLSLQILDLSNNRITEIKNDTLTNLFNLRILNLSGNKLTSIHPVTLPKDLVDINLENNLWRCECYSKDFKEQHDYFTGPPGLTNSRSLRCNSPENVSDLSWSEACGRIWYEMGHGYARSEKLWLYVVSMILAMSVIFCATMCIRRMYLIKVMREEAERERMRMEAQERLNRIRREQQRQIEAQQNAPDPRELVRPPSYHEAIRMPRLDGSYSSLVASRPSLVASNPELNKRERTTNNGGKSTTNQQRRSRKPRTEEERRERRRRRRRRRTHGSSEDITGPGTDEGQGATGGDDENCSDYEASRSMISLTRRMESVELQSEDEAVNNTNRERTSQNN